MIEIIKQSITVDIYSECTRKKDSHAAGVCIYPHGKDPTFLYYYQVCMILQISRLFRRFTHIHHMTTLKVVHYNPKCISAISYLLKAFDQTTRRL